MNDSVVDRYISDLLSVQATPMTIEVSPSVPADHAVQCLFAYPVNAAQCLLVAYQMLVLTHQLPESRLKDRCRMVGWSALNSSLAAQTL